MPTTCEVLLQTTLRHTRDSRRTQKAFPYQAIGPLKRNPYFLSISHCAKVPRTVTRLSAVRFSSCYFLAMVAIRPHEDLVSPIGQRKANPPSDSRDTSPPLHRFLPPSSHVASASCQTLAKERENGKHQHDITKEIAQQHEKTSGPKRKCERKCSFGIQ